jgi:undecaprenyl-diphosphatase
VTFLQALILGIVEGVTEYLPVSSTGHLILAQRALGIAKSDAADAYAICIQAGAILAVLGLYRERIVEMLKGVAGQSDVGRRLAICVIVGFLPAAVAGLGLSHIIKEYLFGLWPVVLAWGAGGVAILALRDRVRGADGRSLDQIDVPSALLIGFAQCLALWPGTSRSLVTILGGVLVGMSLPAAIEFSFLLGLVTLTAATAHDAAKDGHVMISQFGLPVLLAGTAVAAISAAISVKWLVGWLQEHGMALFAAWRLALAGIVAVLLLAGVITAV